MPQTPEDRAREQIEQQLIAAGWVVQDAKALNLTAGRGIAVREFPLAQGHGEADYLLYGDRRALGVIEAKKEGDTLTGVEVQTEKYGAGLPASLPAWRRPLSFLYQSTGIETRFTNALDPDPRSHAVFTFHQPQTLIAWAQGRSGVAAANTTIQEGSAEYGAPSTLLHRLRRMPPLVTESFAAYLKEHHDEITALQFLYSHPHGTPPTLKQLKELAAELKRPPRHWTPEALWQAYTMLEKSKVHGRLQATADMISLVRFALEQATVLAPFSETVNDRFAHWLSSQQAAGSVFTPDQLQWLTMIRDHIAASLTVEPEDFEYVPFSERGGLGRATTLFGDRLPTLLTELTEALTS